LEYKCSKYECGAFESIAYESVGSDHSAFTYNAFESMVWSECSQEWVRCGFVSESGWREGGGARQTNMFSERARHLCESEIQFHPKASFWDGPQANGAQRCTREEPRFGK
jgi:hypothetical protein